MHEPSRNVQMFLDAVQNEGGMCQGFIRDFMDQSMPSLSPNCGMMHDCPLARWPSRPTHLWQPQADGSPLNGCRCFQEARRYTGSVFVC